jgi:cellulose synthase/poly-beta-1,6-N-acetylglucosamine synthase-like glycosyltransferase
MPVVYVDSASTDGSADLARSMGAEVVGLDMSVPFSAARARNEGFERLNRIAPDVRYVMFVDGDCEIVAGFIERAVKDLQALPKAAVVCGRRRERHPEHSVYNELADLEWNRPAGEVQSCGGDSVIRADAFRQVGGYDASVVAGEEPELCQRLREAGWKIYRIDAEMTIHDSAMLRFAQWWKRSVRSGYGAMDVATRFRRGPNPLFVNQVQNARRWVFGWPIAIAAGMIAGATAGLLIGGAWTGWLLAIGAGFAVACLLPLQALRLAFRVRKKVTGIRTALAYGFLTMIGKWAHVKGQQQYASDRASGKNTRLIDYKAAGASGSLAPVLRGEGGWSRKFQ